MSARGELYVSTAEAPSRYRGRYNLPESDADVPGRRVPGVEDFAHLLFSHLGAGWAQILGRSSTGPACFPASALRGLPSAGAGMSGSGARHSVLERSHGVVISSTSSQWVGTWALMPTSPQGSRFLHGTADPMPSALALPRCSAPLLQIFVGDRHMRALAHHRLTTPATPAADIISSPDPARGCWRPAPAH